MLYRMEVHGGVGYSENPEVAERVRRKGFGSVTEYAPASERDAALAELARLTDGFTRQEHEVSQALGKALGFPWYRDDPANFPGATAADGVCTGPDTAASLADMAADRIASLAAEVERLRAELKGGA